ncbi:MAG: TM2 domain-containing protein [Lentisphaeria bacterium]|nr:TM2 domain-containing protein [Lentisphaeria bacterium]
MNEVAGPAKSKVVAIVLAFFLGSLGIHNFYLGYTKKGVIQLILGVVSCGLISAIWALVDIIMIATGSINADANGVPLA